MYLRHRKEARDVPAKSTRKREGQRGWQGLADHGKNFGALLERCQEASGGLKFSFQDQVME